jgi:hypothetical protein
MTLDALEILRVVGDNTRAFLKVRDVLYKVSARLDVIETKLSAAAPASDEEAGPITEQRPTGPLGRLALRQDGGVLLEVTSDLSEDDLNDREVARFVTLNEAEALDAVDRADVGFSDAAARAGWQIARARKGYPVESPEPKS